MKVTRLETTLLKFPLPTRAVPTYSVNPIHIFPDMQPGASGGGGGNRPHMVVLQVETDEGAGGVPLRGVNALRARLKNPIWPSVGFYWHRAIFRTNS